MDLLDIIAKYSMCDAKKNVPKHITFLLQCGLYIYIRHFYLLVEKKIYKCI